MRYLMMTTDLEFATKNTVGIEHSVEFSLDTEHKPFQNWQRMLSMAGNDACLCMEDDIMVCNDFDRNIINAVGFYPDRLISFFTLKRVGVDHITERNGSDFCSALCYFLPVGMAGRLLEYSFDWLTTKRGIENPTAMDYCIADFLKDNKIKYILWSPSLVQHLSVKSRIDPRRSTKRQAINFKG